MTITALNTARYHGLNLTDLQVLLLLAENGPLDMSDLATRTGLTNAGLTTVAKKLVGKLLIQRLRDHWTDGRMVILELGELGRVRIHQITGRFPEPAISSTAH
jgi:DNA-binding MarR family transcriptional regulator